MKTQVIAKTGSSGEIGLPNFFSVRIREDIAQKFYEIMKKQQPYAPFFMAGKQSSASGRVRHSRRLWRNSYGKGISRVPRKIFWRRGDHFYWVGAEISGTRGGRESHPPRVEHFQKKLRMNKKESEIALQSALAATGRIDFVKKRYLRLGESKLELPIVIKLEQMKTSEFFEFMKKILGDAFSVALQTRKERAGKGKRRNRRYKKNAGLLLVIGEKESLKISGIEVRKVSELEMSDIYPLGRLTIYSEEAVKELGKVRGEK